MYLMTGTQTQLNLEYIPNMLTDSSLDSVLSLGRVLNFSNHQYWLILNSLMKK